MEEPSRILFLSDPRARDVALTGGKASSLAVLVGDGQRVPNGFVLTTAAFQGTGAHTSMRPEVREPMRAALASLGGRVAVRSSGVAEDLVGASFAGQYETVLDVDGADDVEAAIARCVASAHAPRVTAYREQRGIASAAMAVLVQKYIPARAAGVAFTAHPVTGERDVVCVSAIAGVGEALVSGAANAEEWEVRQTAVRRRGAAPIINDVDATEVASLARRVAQGKPTDIEWAFTRDATGVTSIHLLQARPMTALPDPVSWAVTDRKGGFIRNFRLGDRWCRAGSGGELGPSFDLASEAVVLLRELAQTFLLRVVHQHNHR